MLLPSIKILQSPLLHHPLILKNSTPVTLNLMPIITPIILLNSILQFHPLQILINPITNHLKTLIQIIK
jgi:hypothetical protein